MNQFYNFKNKAIFLDRDGVINREIGYLNKIEDFEFIDGVFDACNYYQRIGFLIIVITNQSGISRGFYSENDFIILNNWMINQFNKKNVDILDVFFCPHMPNEHCNCRKPSPGLIIDAQQKYNIDLKRSWLIGDKETDIMAGNKAGIENTILVKTGHKIDESMSNAKYILKSLEETIQIIN